MTSYTLPIPELKRLEPILEELFGYRRAMFENELLNVYRTKYPNGISKEVANNYMIACPFLNEIAVDNGAFDYHRYAPRPASTSMELDVKNFIMDTEHEITIALPNNTFIPYHSDKERDFLVCSYQKNLNYLLSFDILNLWTDMLIPVIFRRTSIFLLKFPIKIRPV